MTIPSIITLAAIDPTLVIWFIVGIVYFIAQFFEKIKGDSGDAPAQRPQHPNRPKAEEDLREFLEQLTGHAHHEEEEEPEEIVFQQPVIAFDQPPAPSSRGLVSLDPEPPPLSINKEQQALEDVYKVASDIKDIKEIKSLEASMAESMSRGGSTASMLVKLFNIRMPHTKYSYTASSTIRNKTKPPSLKGKHAFAQAQISRIILEPPKALEEKPFEV